MSIQRKWSNPPALESDGNTPEVAIADGRSGNYYVYADGDFGSGTLIVQVSVDGGAAGGDTWVTARIPRGITAVTGLTAAGFIYFSAPVGSIVRCNLSGSTDPDLNVYMARVND